MSLTLDENKAQLTNIVTLFVLISGELLINHNYSNVFNPKFIAFFEEEIAPT